jgi:nucleotide-binding universal stress UspA family protein
MSSRIERVVVTLDATSENLTAIDTAARLAARAKAPLHGVFFEDDELLRLARLPFARETTRDAGTARFTAELIETQFHAAAEHAREELFAAAKRLGVEPSFEVVRGVAETVLASATERDLVVAGALTRPVAEGFRTECRWLGLVDAAPGPFLLCRRGSTTGGSVVVLLRRHGPSSARLIESALQMAEAPDGGLRVVCLAVAASEPSLPAEIEERLATAQMRLELERASDEPRDLERRIAELDCQLLVIETGAGGRMHDFAERIACDVLVVR